MYIYYCPGCNDLVGKTEKSGVFTCSNCGEIFLSLGIEDSEWNQLSEDEMIKCIEKAKVRATIKKPVFNDTTQNDNPSGFCMYHVNVNAEFNTTPPKIEAWMPEALKKGLLDGYESRKAHNGSWQLCGPAENIDRIKAGDWFMMYNEKREPIKELQAVFVSNREKEMIENSSTGNDEASLLRFKDHGCQLMFDSLKGTPPKETAYVTKKGETLPPNVDEMYQELSMKLVAMRLKNGVGH